ncbi:TPA_asm: major capsid protein [Salmonella enterica subsp. enterica serovar Typhimurium]|nr:major capsid protein [Salmonella enterica subsp. enterica serovar Typhimurium]
MYNITDTDQLKKAVYSTLEDASQFIANVDLTLWQDKINSDMKDFNHIVKACMWPKDWFMSQIEYNQVYHGQPDSLTVSDPALSTGRSADGRFFRESALDSRANSKLFEFDTGEIIKWSYLMQIMNIGTLRNMGSTLVAALFNKMFADDMRIGFCGKSAGGVTDPRINPNGEDVAPGWHEMARQASQGKQVVDDEVIIGMGGDFPNVDAAAQYLINTKIPEAYRSDPRLVVLVGHDLAASERLRLFNTANGGGDIAAASAWSSTIAGKFAFIPGFMPGKRLCVTMISNLHINISAGSFRPEFVMDDEAKIFRASANRYQGYGLTDVNLYAAFDENALEYRSKYQ